ncbi:Rrf2 family transcriptional regulator [Alkalicoccus chagannorensis]|uniref:Rrf2 family transcriptional regulator n=1 Tax=Alkalicoccus chagannorensis TaxID=427072 RepID=UPI00047D372E|nr:Rrf2 family transcriptional regulator [Alkalicoccus chagannorensis]
MRLTQYTDYSLRVLMYTAAKERTSLSRIQDISDAYQISKNHLMKVVYQLGQLGYVETVRGRSGGIRLHQEPEDINVGTLVRQMEDDFHMVECFDKERNQCPITAACTLQHALGEALNAYLNVLDQYTLADITKNKGQLAALLHLQE